mmetsp:Transcript_50135/g.149713  ORF Transcript_50135/g.149713 Transcript_50135/m.149713 type:complete len:130 (-) Transcript_50135:209-598(-)
MSMGLIEKLSQRSLKGAAGARTQEVDLGWCKEMVLVHPEGGPQVYREDGSFGFLKTRGPGWGRPMGGCGTGGKHWSSLSSTEKKVSIEVAAKINASMKERYGEDYFARAELPSKKQIQAVLRTMGAQAS